MILVFQSKARFISLHSIGNNIILGFVDTVLHPGANTMHSTYDTKSASINFSTLIAKQDFFCTSYLRSLSRILTVTIAGVTFTVSARVWS